MVMLPMVGGEQRGNQLPLRISLVDQVGVDRISRVHDMPICGVLVLVSIHEKEKPVDPWRTNSS
jgi:hypothetical protein